ncbi:3-phosphoserine/phosphohydroxythreonine transaminase [Basilea psittacipulmonis]|uniref:Phosphoserine aminotransferase n=1 Tax=Basilea psittacipulmonis DSM 24701 TaxID=1072685 RepID=A0A077DIC3_9BURK|nr:3-phosphoserine/phosphohydroxythreonine transaminase [Basilea psittacipulmonis]AIL32918.1 hypothetical protein IX83_05950 [Basilea psittacipulmonis DSM 24701]
MRAPYNFAAGPAQLPLPVLEKIQEEMLDWHGKGVSVLEMGHRGPDFEEILLATRSALYDLTGVSEADYDFVFMSAGARLQNAFIALNLPGKADYVISGNWSKTTYEQGLAYGDMRITANNEEAKDGVPGLHWAPKPEDWKVRPDATFVHYCHNETLSGLGYEDIPKMSVPVVTDMTSCFLSRRQTWENAGIVYAGAQKNLGIAGLSLVMIRRDLLGKASPLCPDFANYTKLADSRSLLNTPPVFAIYVMGLVLEYMQSIGGMELIERANLKKARMLYEYIDQSGFYKNRVAHQDRSICNVSFLLDDRLNELFLKESKEAGLLNLKGHPISGGMRASIYNAMPVEGVEKLIAFMKDFAKRNG